MPHASRAPLNHENPLWGQPRGVALGGFPQGSVIAGPTPRGCPERPPAGFGDCRGNPVWLPWVACRRVRSLRGQPRVVALGGFPQVRSLSGQPRGVDLGGLLQGSVIVGATLCGCPGWPAEGFVHCGANPAGLPWVGCYLTSGGEKLWDPL